jgi:hypothetical protein
MMGLEELEWRPTKKAAATGCGEDEDQMRSGEKCEEPGAALQNKKVAGYRGESHPVLASDVKEAPAINQERGVGLAVLVEQA